MLKQLLDDRQHHNLSEEKASAAIENKNPSRMFPSYFDKLSETLEDIIEGHVASQGQLVGSRREPARS